MSVVRSLLHWAPHDLARTYSRFRERERYGGLMALRDTPVENEDTVSLRPLLDRRAIFVHVPKCAGLSVSKAIFGCRGAAHMKVSDLRIAFSREEYASFYKFAFVRNPWDRLVSAYYFMRDRGSITAGRDMNGRRFDSFPDFRSFVRDYVARSDLGHHVVLRPQHWFLCRTSLDAPDLDFVGRFENLQEDFDSVCKHIGVDVSLVEKNTGQSRRGDYRAEYDEETAAIAGRAYRRDAELFGYRFE